MTFPVYKVLAIAGLVLIVTITAGCLQPAANPTPTPVPTLAPTVPVAPSAQPVSPTPIGGSDEARIDCIYTVKTYPRGYEGVLPVPGQMIYAIDVTVDSDKPVKTDDSWFSVEYRKNATDSLITYTTFTNVNYPSTVIGNNTGPAKGRLLFFLPDPGEGSQGPAIVYYKPVEQQTGEYKVKNKVYGSML